MRSKTYFNRLAATVNMERKALTPVMKIVVSFVVVSIIIVALGILVSTQTDILTNVGTNSTTMNLS